MSGPVEATVAKSRRRFLAAGGAVVAGGIAASYAWERSQSTDVAVVKADSYDGDLADVIRRGLETIGFGPRKVAGKSVLLKPNLVEPTRVSPHINTHPLFVFAVSEVFRKWNAKEVLIAEGQGHCRDTILVLEQSGLAPMLANAKLPFVDLNHDEIFTTHNRLGATGLKVFHLPETIKRADLIVSLPKMKLHHWAGVTLSMKNFFGVLPGICYGWPKNVLHHAGIENSIWDINATVRPHLAIVDGIIGMEGDGPIMGTPKKAGVVIMGTNLPAVDATGARVMGVDPYRIPTLAAPIARRLGPIDEKAIRQVGEPIAGLVANFQYPAHRNFDPFRGGAAPAGQSNMDKT